MDYRKTLNLPKTSFPMKASLAQREPERIKFWNNLDIYNLLRQKRQGKEKYILHDGPPYANGPIHIGHALNKILKDIIVKFKFLNGFDCPFTVGWDCHGLPVEHQLFKEIKQTKHNVDTLKFRKKARAYALKFVRLQTNDFKRLGVFADWPNPYLTLDPEYEYSVMKLLQSLASDGYIYRGRKPVNWCFSCETALAEAEVEYSDKQSDSLYFLFPVKSLEKASKILRHENIYFCAWTTTPWTIVSNTAVAVHPSLNYLLLEDQGKFIIVAEKLRSQLEKKLSRQLKLVQTIEGKNLEGIKLAHPFLKRTSPVALADFVSSEEGTGCVHIAPGHGQEDFLLSKKYNLEMIMPVAEDGKFIEPDEFAGKDITQASELVISKLKEKNTLVLREKISHSYPHCWRCKEGVIFRATNQWFFDVSHNSLREKLLGEIEKVKWIPAGGRERMKAMIETRPDWCLSRQRLWGAPIPALKCLSCSHVFLDPQLIGKAAEVFRKDGSDSWFWKDLNDFLPQNLNCPHCKKNNFAKEFDILDVWFESGASFAAVLEKNDSLRFPADLYLEGSDQHRGWFQVSLIPAVAAGAQAPYKSVMTHGFAVDGESRKMSKSLGNVIAPQDISKKYGAEILRLWTAFSDYRQDIKISNDIIKQLADLYRKIRNTIRFILGNIDDFDPRQKDFQFFDLPEIDRYMLSRSKLFFQETIAFYGQFSFYKACQNIFHFCNQDLSSFYLDILKDRLYTHSTDSFSRRSAQFVLSKILLMLLKLIAPVLSFTAEEAYGCLPYQEKETSVFISEFKNVSGDIEIDQKLLLKWETFLSLRQKVLKEIERRREEGFVGSSLEAQVVLSAKEKDLQFYQKNKEILTEIFIVSEIILKEGSFNIRVERAKGEKCPRCWNWRKNIGKNKSFPEICLRCAEAVESNQAKK